MGRIGRHLRRLVRLHLLLFNRDGDGHFSLFPIQSFLRSPCLHGFSHRGYLRSHLREVSVYFTQR
jgi:hypothetical protein